MRGLRARDLEQHHGPRRGLRALPERVRGVGSEGADVQTKDAGTLRFEASHKVHCELCHTRKSALQAEVRSRVEYFENFSI